MPKGDKLNERQQRFVDAYLVSLNATQAAIEAGYSPKTAEIKGHQLTKNNKVQAALTRRAAALRETTDITIQRLADEYAPLAFSDMRHYLWFGDNGDAYLDWSQMPKEATKAIAEITQEEYMDGKGEGARLVRRTKFKLHDKRGALDSLAARLWPVPKAEPERPSGSVIHNMMVVHGDFDTEGYIELFRGFFDRAIDGVPAANGAHESLDTHNANT